MFNKQHFIAHILFILCLAASMALSQSPKLLNFQGRLEHTRNGQTVAVDSTVSMQFSIYSEDTTGAALWSETQTVRVTKGIYQVLLGSITALPNTLFNGSSRYLGIKVGNEINEMTPLFQFSSVGYSHYSFNTESIQNRPVSPLTPTSGQVLKWSGSAWRPDTDLTTPSGQAGGGLTGNYPNPSIAADAVGSNQIINNSITLDDIGPNAVGSSELAENVAFGSSNANGAIFIQRTVTPPTQWVTTVQSNVGGGGFVGIWNSAFIETVRMSGIGTGSNQSGAISLYNSVGERTIFLDGSTGNKDFVMQHPNDPGKEIIYVSLEGPEPGVYIRGTGRLQNGEAMIQLPAYFSLVASEQGLTVSATPLSAESYGLAVISKSTTQIVIKELSNGTGNYEFDFIVHAIRKGQEDFEPVRDKVNSNSNGVSTSIESDVE